MSSITGGPVPAYISVGGSKAVAVFRALAGSAFSQRRSLSAVESRTASFSMLFSVKINISRAFFLVKWGNLPFSGRRFPLSLQAGPEDVPGHRCVEQPLHFLPPPGLPQDPHELGHHGLRGHVVGLQHPQIAFVFLCFPLYIVYSALYGIFTIITYYSGFRAGFCFSAGATDLVFSASLPAAAKTWMIIPLGIAAFLVFYFVFYFAITKFDLKTPGREDDDEEAEKKVVLANNNYTEVASAVLAAVGGKENVKEVGYCATRLRFEVLDNAKVDEKAVKAAGAAGVIRPSKNACQVIIGTKVQFVYDELKKML